MGYTRANWQQRLRERSDMTASLVHLTKEGSDGTGALRVLLKILLEKRLLASTTASGFIVGDTPAVCFQDAPLHSIAQNTLFEQKMREAGLTSTVRYLPVGIAFPKPYLYRKGARPVLYEDTDFAKQEILPPDQWWRIVRLDLSDDDAFIDWTHEREWRHPGNLDFDLGEATLLSVDNGTISTLARLYKEASGDDLLAQLRGVVTLRDLLY